MVVLERAHTILPIKGVSVGIAAVKGFVGGFDYGWANFGEPIFREAYSETTRDVEALDRGLRARPGCWIRHEAGQALLRTLRRECHAVHFEVDDGSGGQPGPGGHSVQPSHAGSDQGAGGGAAGPVPQGSRTEVADGAEAMVRRIRRVSDLPVALGFGISTPEHVRQVGQWADAAVVGSALVNVVAEAGAAPDLTTRVEEYVRWLKS